MLLFKINAALFSYQLNNCGISNIKKVPLAWYLFGIGIFLYGRWSLFGISPMVFLSVFESVERSGVSVFHFESNASDWLQWVSVCVVSKKKGLLHNLYIGQSNQPIYFRPFALFVTFLATDMFDSLLLLTEGVDDTHIVVKINAGLSLPKDPRFEPVTPVYSQAPVWKPFNFCL